MSRVCDHACISTQSRTRPRCPLPKLPVRLMDGLSRYQIATNDARLATSGWSALDLVTETRNLRDGRVREGQLFYEKVTRRELLQCCGPLNRPV